MGGTAMAWSPASRREGRRGAAGPEADGHRMARSGRAVASAARHPPKNRGSLGGRGAQGRPGGWVRSQPAEMSGEVAPQRSLPQRSPTKHMSHEAGGQELSGWLSAVCPALSTVPGTQQALKKYVQQTMSPPPQLRAGLLTGAPEAARAREGWAAPPVPTGGLHPSPQQGFSWSPGPGVHI